MTIDMENKQHSTHFKSKTYLHNYFKRKLSISEIISTQYIKIIQCLIVHNSLNLLTKIYV